ncbi:MAG TPA: hypothetical protein VHN14_23530 [Kofleriaceae bacterium]|jgi:hypothetical protein|nr:hypothetical protein [Kofleriaceae bacterium]
MKPDKPTHRDAKYVEGERASPHYDDPQLREFVAGGRGKPAAYQTESNPGARRQGALHITHGSQTQISFDEMVARNRSLADHVRLLVNRALGRLRARLRRT